MPKDANLTPRIVALASLSLAVVATVAQRLLHQSTILFAQIDVVGLTPKEMNEQAQEKIHQFEMYYLEPLKRRVHIETIALTLFILVLLFILYRRKGNPSWTRYVIMASAAASAAGCFLAW